MIHETTELVRIGNEGLRGSMASKAKPEDFADLCNNHYPLRFQDKIKGFRTTEDFDEQFRGKIRSKKQR